MLTVPERLARLRPRAGGGALSSRGRAGASRYAWLLPAAATAPSGESERQRTKSSRCDAYRSTSALNCGDHGKGWG